MSRSLLSRSWDVFLRTWDLGFTSFGGPPTHFQILHKRFVERVKWIDEQTYQEVFALSQALPGPASTKMVYSISFLRGGFVPALMAFLLWSIPGAAGMFGLAMGVSSIGDTLPGPVYALLSGLNAATVGIIAVAAFQLSERAITDPLTRAIVAASAGAGMLYKALWYFPVLMVVSGFATVTWDILGGKSFVQRLRENLRTKKRRLYRTIIKSRPVEDSRVETSPGRDEDPEQHQNIEIPLQHIPLQAPLPVALDQSSVLKSRNTIGSQASLALKTPPRTPSPPQTSVPPRHGSVQPKPLHTIPVFTGVIIIAAFFTSFIAFLVLRGTLASPPMELKLFTNMYLAGTIIFGGGPVVIPLLREYTVAEGWVSSRDFLLGLAVIQAFPGPNFNFSVYLAALTSQHTKAPAIATAIFGFVGIFMPGLSLTTAMISIYPIIRKYRIVSSLLRGINAGAIGLVWTAVYRLWEIGYLTPEATSGVSLGREPWWVVCALTSFVGNKWFDFPAAVSIMLGGVMGLIWYGVTT